MKVIEITNPASYKKSFRGEVLNPGESVTIGKYDELQHDNMIAAIRRSGFRVKLVEDVAATVSVKESDESNFKEHSSELVTEDTVQETTEEVTENLQAEEVIVNNDADKAVIEAPAEEPLTVEDAPASQAETLLVSDNSSKRGKRGKKANVNNIENTASEKV